MSKIAYFFVSFIGAIPAGGTLYLLIKNFLDRADDLGGTLLGVTITAAVCCTLVVLTPFMVLVFYKDTRVQPPPRKTGDEADAADGDDRDEAEAAGFGDVIPDDYDPDELSAATEDDGYDDDGFEDDGFEDDGFEDDFDDEYDFDDE